MLSARDLRVAYAPGVFALDGVSIDVSPGEVVGVLGPNGAGKSTLARVLLGLQSASAGEVRIDEQPLSGLTIAERARRVAAVLQDQGPRFSFSVKEVVALAREARHGAFTRLGPDDLAAVDRAMRAADVLALADRAFDALSGGERQRVLLARALAQAARYLVLDEPTAFLDLHHRYAFADRIRALADAGGAGVVWILHDLDLALRDCHRVYVLAGGRTVAAGAPAEVLVPETLRASFGVEAVLHRDASGRAHVLVQRPV
ncbi:MAG: ABC transporter ATP-binding protein [Deltaproteobacteria bacterium]|nr:ABC transporter ATP-binding protein [Deltaproteobacteria bacterium]